MTTTVLDATTRAATVAATTQDAQRAAQWEPFGVGDVTVRHMAGAVIAEVSTHGPAILNSLTPLGATLGALSASTVNVSGATITSHVFVTAGGTAIFSVPTTDVTLIAPATLTGRRINLAALLLNANSALPLAPTYLLTFDAAETGTVNVDAAGSIVNTGTGACAWSITPPTNVTVTPNSGTVAAGATQALVITATVAATYSLTLVSTGSTITGNPQGMLVNPATATVVTLSVPSSGEAGTAVTVTVTPNGPIPTGGGTVTLAASAGTLGGSTLTFTAGATAAQTTTLTLASAGTASVTMTNDMGLTNSGSPASFTAGLPAWRAPSGDVQAIAAAATLSSIAPSTQAFDPGTEPWKTSNNYQFSTISGYCGGVWVPSMRKWVAMGGGHASYCIPAPYSFDADTLTWAWLHDPLPTDGLSLAASATAVNVAAAYPAHQFDTTEWEWLGSSSAWPSGFAQPGINMPEPAHSYFGNVWVPGASVGNTNGIILKLYPGSGRMAECLVVTRHYLDLDDMTWKHTTNFRSNPSAAAGGSCYFGGSIDRVFSVTNTSGGQWRYQIEIFTPSTLTWSLSASTTFPAFIDISSGGLMAHEPSNLLINVLPATSQTPYTTVARGGVTYTSADQHQFWASKADLLKAGSTATWQQLTISNPGGTWPVRGVYGATCGSIGWAYCPLNGCYYSVSGLHNSDQLWKLSPPAGAVTQADYLSGTWVVSAETLAHGIPSGGTGSATGSVNEPYNRLVWDEGSQSLLWFDYWTGNKPVSINSVDFA